MAVVEADREKGPSIHVRFTRDLMDKMEPIMEWSGRSQSDLIKQWSEDGIERFYQKKTFIDWLRKNEKSERRRR